MQDIMLQTAVCLPTGTVNKKVLAARGAAGQGVLLTNAVQEQMKALGSRCKQSKDFQTKAVVNVSLVVTTRQVQLSIFTAAAQVLEQAGTAERSVVEMGDCSTASRLRYDHNTGARGTCQASLLQPTVPLLSTRPYLQQVVA